jgi:DNA-binding transcriptional LysR family regulator
MERNKFDGLLALKIVAKERNFTIAANVLGISPSAVSQLIKQLESRLGVALLNRTTRTTHLTEAGERFLNQAGPALDQLIAALEDVKHYAGKPIGLLRLNMPKVVYSTYLAPILSSFITKYPELSVELFFEDDKTDIVESGFDAGIRISDILIKDMVAIKLFGPVCFVAAASPEYLNKKGRPELPQDLLNHNCIRFRFGKDRLYDRWEFKHQNSEFQVHVKGSLIFNDSLAMINAAENGDGIVYTIKEAIQSQVNAGKLEIILNSFSTSSTGFYLYYPKNSQMMSKLRAFINYIKNYE